VALSCVSPAIFYYRESLYYTKPLSENKMVSETVKGITVY